MEILIKKYFFQSYGNFNKKLTYFILIKFYLKFNLFHSFGNLNKKLI
jgi:hypothetical protein